MYTNKEALENEMKKLLIVKGKSPKCMQTRKSLNMNFEI